MTYTIDGAAFANPDHTAAVIQTVEAGAVLTSKTDTPELWAEVFKAKPAAFSIPFDPVAVKAECQRRIYAVVDQIAQVNLAAAAAGSLLDESQMAVYRSGLSWVASMRAACGTLIGNSDQTFTEDKHWPVPAASILALADAF